MSAKKKYMEFLDIPFPADESDDEILVDILFDLRLYDDYVSGSLDKFFTLKESKQIRFEYDNNIEMRLLKFLSCDNSEVDKIAAKKYLSYTLKIKEILIHFNS